MNFSLTTAGELLLRASWQAGILALIIFAAQWLAASRISARWRYNLWMLVILRLLLPVVPSTQWSLHNWLTLPKKSPPELPQDLAPIKADLSVVVLESAPIPIQPAPPRILTTPPVKTWRTYAAPAAWGLWLAGFCFFLLRTLIATVRLRKQTRNFTPITSPQVLQILDSARQRMRIHRSIGLFSAANLNTPALMGLIRPRILLPAGVLNEFHPSELRLIFLHELAHLRRRDIAINWLISILNMLHWFNPMLWFAFSRIRAERELACDELVLKSSQPDERREYGNTMIKLLQAFSAGSALPGAVGILEGQAPLRRRITMIAQFERKQSRTWIALLTTLILAMVALTDSAVAQQRGNGPRHGGNGGVPAAGEAFRPQAAPGTAAAPAPAAAAAPQDGPNPRFANVEIDKNAEAANEKTRATLRKPLPEVKFENVTLKDALAFIQDVTELNIYIDWKNLEGAGIPQDVPLSLRLRNVPAGEVLRLMLAQVTPELRYRIETGIVVISTSIPEPVAVIKAYNVEDLTKNTDAQMLRSIDTLEERLKSATEEATRDQFRQQIATLHDAIEQRRGLRMQELVLLIESTVAPYATAGMAVRSFDNKLIITADEAGHQEVAKVLTMLREKGEGAGAGTNTNKGGGATAP